MTAMCAAWPLPDDDGASPIRCATFAFATVERRVIALEGAFGRQRLIALVASVDAIEFSGHTDFYRQLVRGHHWPNVARPGSVNAFITEFAASLVAYADVAFLALRYLAGDRDVSLDEAFRWTRAAEALRGQYGKQSPSGLDARIEALCDNLYHFVKDEDCLQVLGSLPSSLLSAEASFTRDLSLVQAKYAASPTIDSIAEWSTGYDSVAWRFLRRHARWSLARVAQAYRDAVDIRESSPKTCERVMSDERLTIYNALPPIARHLADALVALNFLNLALEPAFSFKGCVGVSLGLVFRRAQEQGWVLNPDAAETVSDKWTLLEGVAARSPQCVIDG